MKGVERANGFEEVVERTKADTGLGSQIAVDQLVFPKNKTEQDLNALDQLGNNTSHQSVEKRGNVRRRSLVKSLWVRNQSVKKTAPQIRAPIPLKPTINKPNPTENIA